MLGASVRKHFELFVQRAQCLFVRGPARIDALVMFCKLNEQWRFDFSRKFRRWSHAIKRYSRIEVWQPRRQLMRNTTTITKTNHAQFAVACLVLLEKFRG